MARFIATSLLSLSLLVVSTAEAVENHPFWTEQALFHFGDDVFFTGRSSCAPNVEEGRQRAYVAAVQEVKNFTRAQEIGGFPLDTQMVFEEPHPPDCPPGLVTVWRLLRAPKTIARIPHETTYPWQAGGYFANRRPHHSQSVISLHASACCGTKCGTATDFPVPSWAHPDRGELTWEYSQFGLTIVFNQDDVVTRWRLNGPHPRSSDDTPSATHSQTDRRTESFPPST